MSENVGASTSRNPKGLHGLYRDNFTFYHTWIHYEFLTFLQKCLYNGVIYGELLKLTTEHIRIVFCDKLKYSATTHGRSMLTL
jgi:hypothetical protein